MSERLRRTYLESTTLRLTKLAGLNSATEKRKTDSTQICVICTPRPFKCLLGILQRNVIYCKETGKKKQRQRQIYKKISTILDHNILYFKNLLVVYLCRSSNYSSNVVQNIKLLSLCSEWALFFSDETVPLGHYNPDSWNGTWNSDCCMCHYIPIMKTA